MVASKKCHDDIFIESNPYAYLFPHFLLNPLPHTHPPLKNNDMLLLNLQII